MLNVVQFSGGKDSTCMLLKMLEKNIQVDYIIFCDTGKEFPQMYKHIEKVKDYINKKYGKEITTLKADKTFDYWMFDHVKTRGKNKGKKGYGWANDRIRWCTSSFKTTVTDKFLKETLKGSPYKSFIGIAYDEPKRHEKILNNPLVAHPLFDWKITEKDALEYCYSLGFDWEGLYEDFDRLSCWCCPLKNLKELRILYHKYPALWEELKEMDKKSYNQFKSRYSVQDLEEKFKKEDLLSNKS